MNDTNLIPENHQTGNPSEPNRKKKILVLIIIVLSCFAGIAVCIAFLFFPQKDDASTDDDSDEQTETAQAADDGYYCGNLITSAPRDGGYLNVADFWFPLQEDGEVQSIMMEYNIEDRQGVVAGRLGYPVDTYYYRFGEDNSLNNGNAMTGSPAVWRETFGGDGNLQTELWISGDDFAKAGVDCTQTGAYINPMQADGADVYAIYYDGKNKKVQQLYRIGLRDKSIERVDDLDVDRFFVSGDKIYHINYDDMILNCSETDGSNTQQVYSLPDKTRVLAMMAGRDGKNICLLTKSLSDKTYELTEINTDNGAAETLFSTELTIWDQYVLSGNLFCFSTEEDNDVMSVYSVDLSTGKMTQVLNVSRQGKVIGMDIFEGYLYVSFYPPTDESPTIPADTWYRMVYRLRLSDGKTDVFSVSIDGSRDKAIGKWE